MGSYSSSTTDIAIIAKLFTFNPLPILWLDLFSHRYGGCISIAL